MNFLDKKKSLLEKVANINSVSEIGSDYKREFFDFLLICFKERIISLEHLC